MARHSGERTILAALRLIGAAVGPRSGGAETIERAPEPRRIDGGVHQLHEQVCLRPSAPADGRRPVRWGTSFAPPLAQEARNLGTRVTPLPLWRLQPEVAPVPTRQSSAQR